MTEHGLKKLKEELKVLESIEWPRANASVKKARRFCDFSEDPTFHEAVNELASLNQRRKELEHMIRHAAIIENASSHIVRLGSKVTFQELSNGDIQTFTIVGATEADPLNETISNESPLAKSLLGAKMKDIVSLHVPDGEIKVKILDIR
ncbi:MAG TPA: transcription elongation factor GreA [Cerasibacillus sp.]|uniref:transcription elongation factor GreA n=1 Tax=Cerasibacillus sp. TaxID=2498711 RepID=UPI002F4081A2